MKVAAILGPSKAGIVDKLDPKPKDHIVVVKVHSAPLCTEFNAFREGKPSDSHGHEAAGEVVAVDRATGVKVGDRVLVQPQNACGRCELCVSGAYIHCQHQEDVLKITGSQAGTATIAQYLLKADWLLTPIPDGLSYDHAAMGCCGLGPTFGAMQLMRVDAFDTVLITGLGPVGLGGVINARYRGARVIGVEANPYRAALAKKLGACAVIDPRDASAVKQVMDLTGGLGADKCVETSGRPETKPFLLDAVARSGQVALVGWSGQPRRRHDHRQGPVRVRRVALQAPGRPQAHEGDPGFHSRLGHAHHAQVPALADAAGVGTPMHRQLRQGHRASVGVSSAGRGPKPVGVCKSPASPPCPCGRASSRRFAHAPAMNR